MRATVTAIILGQLGFWGLRSTFGMAQLYHPLYIVHDFLVVFAKIILGIKYIYTCPSIKPSSDIRGRQDLRNATYCHHRQSRAKSVKVPLLPDTLCEEPLG